MEEKSFTIIIQSYLDGRVLIETRIQDRHIIIEELEANISDKVIKLIDDLIKNKNKKIIELIKDDKIK